MKIRIILLFIIIFTTEIYAQDTWVKTYTPFEEEWVEGIGWIEFDVTYDVEDILVTQDGGFLVSGTIDRTIDDDPPHWWDHWGFLMKTDSDGNLLWADADSVSFMGENDNYAIVETSEGDFISLGYALWGGGYMIKRDCNGNRLWDMEYIDFGANSMHKTNDGNIILGGVVSNNIALRKIDNDGNTIWTRSHDCGTTTIAQSITQTQNSDYLLTGTLYYYDAPNNIIVLKTDANGDSLWMKIYDINEENNQGNCILETSDNKILCSGTDGLLSKFEHNGDVIFNNNYNSWNIRSCLELFDNNYLLFMAAAVMKINSDGDSLLFSNLQLYQGVPSVYNSIKELENGYFVLVSSQPVSRMVIVKMDSEGYYTGYDKNTISIANISILYNYPNPFNPATTINYNLGLVVRNPIMEICNIKGQCVRELNIENEIHRGGQECKIVWDGTNQSGASVSSGVYLYRIKGDNFISGTEKMILMK
jgi:hypothetical protein